MVSAVDICATAASLVGGDRARTHGNMVQTHANIAALWQAYLTTRRDPAAPLNAVDAAHMMILLKLSRTQTGESNGDDYVDMVGYAGVAGEIASDGLG